MSGYEFDPWSEREILAAVLIFLSRLASSAKTFEQGLNLHLLRASSQPGSHDSLVIGIYILISLG